MIMSLLIPIIMGMLPIEDNMLKMQIGVLIGEVFARGYLSAMLEKIFKYLKKKQIIIPEQTDDIDHNPIFHKVQEYLAIKFSKSIENCELVPKNGEIEFSLSDFSGTVFTDKYEINSVFHTFNLSIQTVRSNPFNTNATAVRQIVISSTTAKPDDIKVYIKLITTARSTNTNLIKIYKPVVSGKKKDERSVSWEYVMVKTNKTLKNTVYSEHVEKELFEDVDRFMVNEQWYADRGIPYKRGYFLYSTPGQGKTSVAKIMANKYGVSIFCLDLTIIDENSQLNKLMTEISYFTCHERYILLIEDVDRTEFIARNSYKPPPLSMDCFLNAIDGVAEPHGRILLMSANNPENILNNTALIRPGRIDKCIEMHNCTKYQIRKLYNLFYADHPYTVEWDNWECSGNLSAAYVIKLLQENIDRPEVFMRLIGEPIVEEPNELDQATRDSIEFKKSTIPENKHTDNRDFCGGRRRGQRRVYSSKVEDKIRRTKCALKRSQKMLQAAAQKIEKAESKLPLFLEQLKKKQESEKLAKLKAKAKKRQAYIAELAKAAKHDEYIEEEYETPAFLANSIEAEEVAPDTITTYEVMGDE